MNKYVTGFLFDTSNLLVAVVKKESPGWMKGKYTGVGGKILPGETAAEAMDRECLEEFAYKFDWREYAILSGKVNRDGIPFVCHMFVAHTTKPALVLPKFFQTEQGLIEKIEVLPLYQIKVTNSIPNVPWLIQMALSMPHDSSVSLFNIEEMYICPF